jgi:hypothetical protein
MTDDIQVLIDGVRAAQAALAGALEAEVERLAEDITRASEMDLDPDQEEQVGWMVTRLHVCTMGLHHMR